jgi:opacity protein-like surface antigen
MKLLLSLLTIIPLTIFSQDKDSTKTGRFSFGVAFSPDYCYRTLKPNASSKLEADNRDTVEIPKIGYTAGLILSYQLNKRFLLGVGILFSDKGYKMKKTYSWIAPNGSNGTGDPAVPMKRHSNYHYYYFDMPINLNYCVFSTEKTAVYVFASISPNIFLTQKATSYTEYGDGHKATSTVTTPGYNIVNSSFTAGLGYQVNLSDKLFLKIEPTYRRFISSSIDTPIKEYLYSAGLNIGLYYKPDNLSTP